MTVGRGRLSLQGDCAEARLVDRDGGTIALDEHEMRWLMVLALPVMMRTPCPNEATPGRPKVD